MASTQLTLSATPTQFQLPAPTGRVKVTVLTAPSAVNTVVVTADGSYPTLPGNSVTNNAGATVIAGIVGQIGVIQPPLFGNHMAAATLALASTGNPVVLLEW